MPDGIYRVSASMLIFYFAVDNRMGLNPGITWRRLAPVAVHADGLDPRTLHPLGIVAQSALGGGGGVGLYRLAVLQLRQWWIPYLFEHYPLHSDFRWYIEHGYTETLRIPPQRGARPPGPQHMTLQMLP